MCEAVDPERKTADDDDARPRKFACKTRGDFFAVAGGLSRTDDREAW